jgi:phosphoribosyl 1,2-cyclic phosphodiesterase
MRIRFWGTRGSIPVPGEETTIFGGNTTCVELITESGKRIIIDAGTGIRSLGDRLVEKGESLNLNLLITHIHWDHVIGFPFFAPIYSPGTAIEIDGTSSCMNGLKYIFDNRMGDGFFPIRFDDLKAKIEHKDRLRDGPISIDDLIIDSTPLQHPQGGLGFRFCEGRKRLIFLTDNELTQDAWKGSHPEDFVRFCSDADILIHDAQYLPEEIADRRGWGHSDHASALDLAIRSGAGKLIFFHHDPSRIDQEVADLEENCKALARQKGSGIVIEAAREGSEIIL